jgi:phosphoribosylamine--glycine ligase
VCDEGGGLISKGGRVLSVAARGRDVEEARFFAYDVVEKIGWDHGFFRRDIGGKGGLF